MQSITISVLNPSNKIFVPKYCYKTILFYGQIIIAQDGLNPQCQNEFLHVVLKQKYLHEIQFTFKCNTVNCQCYIYSVAFGKNEGNRTHISSLAIDSITNAIYIYI